MIFFRRTFRERVGPVERALAIAATAALVGIALWFLARGREVDPGRFRLDDRALAEGPPAPRLYQREPVVLASRPVAADPVEPLLGAPPAGLRLAGRVESFGPDDLYAKIDGRESLYKSYAFRRLWAATFEVEGGRVEVEVFQHGTELDAFGVLSAERKGFAGGRHEADRTLTSNGVFRVVGAYYLRLFGDAESAAIRDAAARLAEHLAAGLRPPPPAAPAPAAAHPAPGPARSALAELLAAPAAWSPARNPLVVLGAEPASIELSAEDGLGVAAFKRYFSGELADGGARVRAFVVACADPAAAAAALEAYRKQITPTGKPVTLPWTGRRPSMAATRVDLLDTVEAAATVGSLVVGVTEAPGPEAAGRVLARVVRALEAP